MQFSGRHSNVLLLIVIWKGLGLVSNVVRQAVLVLISLQDKLFIVSDQSQQLEVHRSRSIVLCLSSIFHGSCFIVHS